jgi:hypothetical protein
MKDKEIENDVSKVSANAKFCGQSDDLLQYPSSLCDQKVRRLDFHTPVSPFEPPLRTIEWPIIHAARFLRSIAILQFLVTARPFMRTQEKPDKGLFAIVEIFSNDGGP